MELVRAHVKHCIRIVTAYMASVIAPIQAVPNALTFVSLARFESQSENRSALI